MLARTFLRLCALEAVRPSSLPVDTPDDQWPTIATSFWFDSRLDPIDETALDERRSVGAVYTEDDHQERISQTGALFFQECVDLVFEISVVAMARGDGDEIVIGTPYTDAELDAALDLLENQVWFCLIAAPSGALFRRMSKKIRAIRSHVMRSGEEAVRLAARTITYKVDLADVCYQGAPTAPLAGLDRLPPFLKSIADGLAGSAYYAKVIDAVAARAPAMPVATPLQSVGATIDPRTARGAPPDSAAEVVAEFTPPQ